MTQSLLSFKVSVGSPEGRPLRHKSHEFLQTRHVTSNSFQWKVSLVIPTRKVKSDEDLQWIYVKFELISSYSSQKSTFPRRLTRSTLNIPLELGKYATATHLPKIILHVEPCHEPKFHALQESLQVLTNLQTVTNSGHYSHSRLLIKTTILELKPRCKY